MNAGGKESGRTLPFVKLMRDNSFGSTIKKKPIVNNNYCRRTNGKNDGFHSGRLTAPFKSRLSTYVLLTTHCILRGPATLYCDKTECNNIIRIILYVYRYYWGFFVTFLVCFYRHFRIVCF